MRRDQWVYCPEPGCASPAEVYDVYTAESTDGPIEHGRVRCLSPDRHHFVMPTDRIERMEEVPDA